MLPAETAAPLKTIVFQSDEHESRKAFVQHSTIPKAGGRATSRRLGLSIDLVLLQARPPCEKLGLAVGKALHPWIDIRFFFAIISGDG